MENGCRLRVKEKKALNGNGTSYDGSTPWKPGQLRNYGAEAAEKSIHVLFSLHTEKGKKASQYLEAPIDEKHFFETSSTLEQMRPRDAAADATKSRGNPASCGKRSALPSCDNSESM